MKDLIVSRTKISEIKAVSDLFNEYRIFYNAEDDIDGSVAFLTKRLNCNQSIIFAAQLNGIFVGFVQLFPMFSSVSMTPVYILNDLYVKQDFRHQGIATCLINTALTFAKISGCSRVSLSTAPSNPAQKLYEKLGFIESLYKFYNFSLIN